MMGLMSRVSQGHSLPPNPAHAARGSTGRDVEAPGICGLYSSTGGFKVVLRIALYVFLCKVQQICVISKILSCS